MKRHGNKLTASAVRVATEPGLYGDGHGLYLQISTFDTKSWVFRYMIDGRPRKMGLGALHTVCSRRPVSGRQTARLKVLDGIDPIEDAEAKRAERRLEAARAMTFKAMC